MSIPSVRLYELRYYIILVQVYQLFFIATGKKFRYNTCLKKLDTVNLKVFDVNMLFQE